MQSRNMLDCATRCLGDDGKCLACEFNESTKTCRLSDELAQKKESNEHSAAKVYTGM